MGLLKAIRDYEREKDFLHDRVNEFGEFVTKLPYSNTRDDLLKQFGVLQQSLGWLNESWEGLVEVLDEQVRLN